jgi:hypothetical protein
MSRSIGQFPLPAEATITPASACALGPAIIRSGAGAAASGASPWSSANILLAFPFVLEAPTTFLAAFQVNGTSAGGNSEIGICDSEYTDLVHTGSFATSGNSTVQFQNFVSNETPTLPPGLYYGAITHSSTSMNQLYRFSVSTLGTAFWRAMGCWRSTSSVNPGNMTGTYSVTNYDNIAFPLFGFATRVSI